MNPYGSPTASIRLLSRDDVATNRSWSIGKNAGVSADFLQFFLFSSGISNTCQVTGLADEGGWLIVTFNNGVMTATQNGVSRTITGAIPATIDADPADLLIFRRSDVTEWDLHPLNQIVIYNRALTADEVATFV